MVPAVFGVPDGNEICLLGFMVIETEVLGTWRWIFVF